MINYSYYHIIYNYSYFISSYLIQFSRDSTATIEATSKSPGLLDELYNSLQGVIAKINGINLGDKTILRLHFTNYLSFNAIA